VQPAESIIMNSQGFQCLACECEPLHIEQDLASLQKHFASKHCVPNLLSSPATQAVVPPRRLGCHADSCNQNQSLYVCIFCGGTGLRENEMKEHLGRIHGGFFKQSWKSFSSSHCSCFAAVHWGWGPVLNPEAGGFLKSMKKEENIVAAEEDLVVGGTDNIFSFEEMKRTTQRNRMFSTNKMKQDIELENLKTGREELMLEQSELWKEGLHSTKMMKEGLQESKMMEGMEEPNTLKGWQEDRKMLKEGLEDNKILKEGLEVTKCEAKVDDHQVIQSSLEAVMKEKSEMEGELAKLKSMNLRREELKVEKGGLEDLRSEVIKAKKGEVSRKIKLGAVVLDALLDSKGKLRKYKLGAEVEKMSPDLKGDVIEVVLKGTEHAVEKADQLLRQLTSTYLLMPLKDSERSVLSAGDSLLLEQIRRMTDAAIGYKDGGLYIFGTERERLEAKEMIKGELKLCTSSSWRRWGFLRSSSNIGRR